MSSALTRHVAAHQACAGFPRKRPSIPQICSSEPCDVLVPAAVEGSSPTECRATCRILAEAANGPTTPEADQILDSGGTIFVIPDILCNAGGVIVSYFEWVQDLQWFFWDEKEVIDRLHRALERSFQRVMERARTDGLTHRDAAMAIGVETVRRAKQTRGLFP